MPLTRDERQTRMDELERWITDQHNEFPDEAFTDEVRELWKANTEELEEHKRVMAELATRDKRIKELADKENHHERGAGFGGGRSSGPQIISRMSEHEVYDVSSVRANYFDPASSRRELRDRAMRAVEIAHFPEWQQGTYLRGRPVTKERAQAYVGSLVDRYSETDDYLSRRILLTGAPAYRSAFGKAVMAHLHGYFDAGFTAEEARAVQLVRAMGVQVGSTGGFAVPYMLDPTVIPTSNLSVNPYRAICRVDTIPGNEWRGVTSAGVTAQYQGEGVEAPDNSPVLAQPNLLMIRADCFVPVNIELTQDWGGLQTELANLIQDAKDDLEAVQFTTGVGGANNPTGLITGATTTQTAGGSGAFAIADLYLLEQAVPPRFRPRSQIIANRFVWNKIRAFDTAGGAGLLVFLPAGLDNDVPRGGNLGVQVLGYGANEASAMVAALTTGSKIAVMGDPRYFIIVDRIGMDIEVIPHIFGPAGQRPLGQRGFYAFWRNNARVLDVNAFRVLVTG